MCRLYNQQQREFRLSVKLAIENWAREKFHGELHWKPCLVPYEETPHITTFGCLLNTYISLSMPICTICIQNFLPIRMPKTKHVSRLWPLITWNNGDLRQRTVTCDNVINVFLKTYKNVTVTKIGLQSSWFKEIIMVYLSFFVEFTACRSAESMQILINY